MIKDSSRDSMLFLAMSGLVVSIAYLIHSHLPWTLFGNERDEEAKPFRNVASFYLSPTACPRNDASHSRIDYQISRHCPQLHYWCRLGNDAV